MKKKETEEKTVPENKEQGKKTVAVENTTNTVSAKSETDKTEPKTEPVPEKTEIPLITQPEKNDSSEKTEAEKKEEEVREAPTTQPEIKEITGQDQKAVPVVEVISNIKPEKNETIEVLEKNETPTEVFTKPEYAEHKEEEKEPEARPVEKSHELFPKNYIRKIPSDRIRPNMYQPRRNFDEAALQELADSIRENGLLQPITVWKDQDREYYEIIAGERRLRACKMAGMKEIDAIVRENLSDEKKLELALIENIQREDLNPIDTAMAYRQLVDHFGITQAEISRIVGKSRAAISNTLRLMELEENIRNAVRSGLISEGHARALLAIPDRQKRQLAFQKIVAERMTVREAEALAQNYYDLDDAEKAPARKLAPKSSEIIDIQSTLSRHFGSKVEIRPGANGKKGKIVISYYSVDDFERITSILRR